MPKAPSVRKTKSARCMRASNDPTEAKEKRQHYITSATKIIKKLQRHAERILRDCEQVLSECNGSRQDIEILKRFSPSEQNEQFGGCNTIEFESAMVNFEDYVKLAERNDKKAGGE
jgi:hypothetical protein